MNVLQALLELAVRFWPATVALSLWAWRYIAGGKKGWTRRATNWTARRFFPERPVHRRHHDVNPDPRSFSAEQRARIIRRDGDLCRCTGCRSSYCCHGLARDGQAGVRLECDHIHPWSAMGRTKIVNGQMLCGPCNRAKGARLPDTDERRWAA